MNAVEEPDSSFSLSDGETERAPREKQMLLDSFVSKKRTAQEFARPQPILSKSRAKKSVVWNFFKKSTENEKFAICQVKTCKAQILWSGNTSNCKKHLERHHAQLLRAAEGNETVVSSTSSEENDHNAKKTKVKQTSMRKFIKNTKGAYNATSAKKIQLDQKLVKLVVRDLQPLCIVDDPGFNEFVQALDPRYPLPSRRHLSDVLIANTYDKTRSNLLEILTSVKYIGITFDGWTSCTTQHYLTVTAHFLKNNALKTATLAVTPINTTATAKNLSSIISKIFDVYKNLLVVAAVTDSAKNVIACCNDLKMTRLPCAAHTVQLVIKHALASTKSKNLDTNSAEDSYLLEEDINILIDDDEDEIGDVSIYSLLKKCKKIASFFHHSSAATKALEEELLRRNLPLLKLQQAVATRWNSVYAMLERIHKNFDAIVYVLLIIPNNLPPLSSSCKEIIHHVLAVLKPFKDVTEQLSGDSYATMSLIIPSTKHILTELNMIKASLLRFPEVMKLHEGLTTNTYKYLMPYEERRLIPGLCTVLDPRFKEHGFYLQSNYLKVKSALKNLLKHEVKATDKSYTESYQSSSTCVSSKNVVNGMYSFLNSIPATTVTTNTNSQAIIHLNKYLEQGVVSLNTDVLAFWQNYNSCKELKNIALRYLIIPASSAPSERVNSTAGNTITDKRSRLSPLMAEKLVFLKQNFEFLKL